MNPLKKYFLALIMFCSLAGHSQSLHHTYKDLPCLNKNIEIYVHIALDSLRNANTSVATIQAAVDFTNQYFEPICLSFSICQVDTITNYNYDSVGTDREEQEIRDLFLKRNRLNLVMVSELQSPTICGYGGYATIFMKKGCGGGTLVHEMGHVFGLPHTFAGGDELVDGSNSDTAGDFITDTPADPYIAGDTLSKYVNGCEFIFEELDPNGQFYQPDVGNIMSYYPCSCGFTREQYLKMVETYQNANPKLW